MRLAPRPIAHSDKVKGEQFPRLSGRGTYSMLVRARPVRSEPSDVCAFKGLEALETQASARKALKGWLCHVMCNEQAREVTRVA